MNEVADDLGSIRLAGCLDRVDEIADEVTRSNGVTRNIDFVDKAADELPLGSNRGPCIWTQGILLQNSLSLMAGGGFKSERSSIAPLLGSLTL